MVFVVLSISKSLKARCLVTLWFYKLETGIKLIDYIRIQSIKIFKKIGGPSISFSLLKCIINDYNWVSKREITIN